MQTIKTVLLRTLSLFIVWWALTEGDGSGAPFGAVVSLMVALVSVRLFPPGTYAVRPGTYRLRALGTLLYGPLSRQFRHRGRGCGPATGAAPASSGPGDSETDHHLPEGSPGGCWLMHSR